MIGATIGAVVGRGVRVGSGAIPASFAAGAAAPVRNDCTMAALNKPTRRTVPAIRKIFRSRSDVSRPRRAGVMEYSAMLIT